MFDPKMKTLTVRRRADDAVVAEIYVESDGHINLVAPNHYIETDVQESADMLTLQKQAKRAINLMAGQMRAQYVSRGHGIDLVYMRKEQEARSWDAAGRPDITDGDTYPWMWAESQALGITPLQTAIRIKNRIDQLDQIGSQMEGARMLANQNIDNAMTVEEVAAAKMAGLQALEAFRV